MMLLCCRHAQALATVKAYSSWLAQFYIESQDHTEQRQKCISFINTTIEATVPLFNRQVGFCKNVHSSFYMNIILTQRFCYHV